MNLDDLIQLLLFFVFIVVPLLSRVGRRRTGKQPGGQKPSAPRTEQNAPQPRSQRSSSQQPRPSPAQRGLPGEDEFSKRLEEARRRVREAVEGQTSQGRSSADTVAGQESASDLFRPSPPSPPAGQLSTPNTPSTPGPRPLVTQRPVSSSFLPSESETASGPPRQVLGQYSGDLRKRKKTQVSKPLQVQRSLGAKRAKLRGPLLQFGEDDLMRGIIWKQILDEPRAKESWRQQSQRR